MIELKPEEKVEIIIGTWLTEYNNQVYYNRNSKIFDSLIPGYKTFKVKGIMKKPDMVVFFPLLNQYFALELKDADKSINIRKGSKIVDYYSDYVTKKVKYFVDDKEIKISQFLLATQFSKEGHIFKQETLQDNRKSESKGKRFAANKGIIPKKEYIKTHEFIRQLWQDWNRNVKVNECSLGLLLSGDLDGEKENYPAFFSQIFTFRWFQNWKVIK